MISLLQVNGTCTYFTTIMKKIARVLADRQHGFRAGYSCSTQLISLTEEISPIMDALQQVDLILLDFPMAFDSVLHCRLLKKL